jgi:hypothetical protein
MLAMEPQESVAFASLIREYFKEGIEKGRFIP